MLTLTLLFSLLLLSFPLAAQDELHAAHFIEGKFADTNGKTLLFIGQDSDTIASYVKYLPQDPLEGVTLYSMLKSADPERTLYGIFDSADWNAGEVSFNKTLSMTPHAALAVGLATDQCSGINHNENIASGKYDASLKVLLHYFKSLSPRPVFLRFAYEFDGPWNCYEPASFKAAFRRVKKAIEDEKLDNVVMVWQSATWPDPTIAGENTALYDHRSADHLVQWYPGDDVVDWIAMSTFYRDLSQWHYVPVDTPQLAQQRVLAFARAHNKPVMIAEAAPQAYRIGTQTHSFIGLNKQRFHSAQHIWRDWFIPFFSFIHANKDVIRAVAYINAHWESQKMWYCAENASPPASNCPQGNWGDSRVYAHPFIKQKWLKEVNNSEFWVQSHNVQQ